MQVPGEAEKRLVAQLLTLMDGLEKRANLVVIAATTGLLIVVVLMSLIAFTTLSESVSNQFVAIINMAVTLVVMAYVAAGLSLMFGTRERPPTSSDRLVGMGALLACGLLIWSTPVQTLVGAMVIALLAWAAYRGFSRRPPPPVKPPPPAR